MKMSKSQGVEVALVVPKVPMVPVKWKLESKGKYLYFIVLYYYQMVQSPFRL
jgi:hypothetical protein